MKVSPQVENGHTDIANEIIDYLCGYRISGEEWQVLWVIIRKTYGWHKKQDWISLSQFCELTQMPKSSVCRAIRKLIVKKVIIKNNSVYLFNKNYSMWTREYSKYDREKIFKRDNYTCHWCGKKFPISQLEVDHLIPLVENGSNKEDNLVTSCRTCNRQRGIKKLNEMQKKKSDNNDTNKESKVTIMLPRGDNNDTNLVTKVIPTKETIQKKLLQKKYILSEYTQKELTQKELTQKELTQKELLEKNKEIQNLVFWFSKNILNVNTPDKRWFGRTY